MRAERNTIKFRSRKQSVKGIVALLIRVLSDHTPEEIVNTQLYFIDEIQLREHLSPTRSNGLNAMLRRMIEYALAYK